MNDLCEEYSHHLDISEEENDTDFGDLETQIKDIQNGDFMLKQYEIKYTN